MVGAGPQIDGFEILEEIGSGGFSRVYRAVQSDIGRDVAIKVLNNGFEDDRQKRTFARECKAMGRLSSHPNVVTVYQAAYTIDGRPCIVMELYHSNLRERLRQSGPLPIRDVIDTGIAIASALDAVHRDGILHRDVKPHNIFVSAHGPALADFGISSVSHEGTITGGGGFSLDYSAPEILESGTATAASDVYALGATLHHLASGETPYPYHGDPSERMAVTIRRIIADPPPRLTRADAPEAFRDVLEVALAKDPAQRPASAAEFALRLRSLVSTSTSTLTSPPGPASTSPAPDHPHAIVVPPTAAAQTDGHTLPTEHLPTGGVLPAADTPVSDDHNASQEQIAGRRRLVMGATITLAIVIIGALIAVALGFGSGGDTTTPPSTTTSLSEADTSFFDVVDPPSDLTVVIADSDAILDWVAPDGDVMFEVTNESTGERRPATEAPYTWADVSEVTCFEVVAMTATRVSQPARACP